MGLAFEIGTVGAGNKSPLATSSHSKNYQISGVYLNPSENATMLVAGKMFFASTSQELDLDPGHLYLMVNNDLLEMKQHVSKNGCVTKADKKKNKVISENSKGEVIGYIGLSSQEIACLRIKNVDLDFVELVNNGGIAGSMSEVARSSRNANNKTAALFSKAQALYGAGAANLFRQLMLPDENCATGSSAQPAPSSGQQMSVASFEPGDTVAVMGNGGNTQGGTLGCNQAAKPTAGQCGSASLGGGGGCGFSIGCGGNTASGGSLASSMSPKPQDILNKNPQGYAMEGGTTPPPAPASEPPPQNPPPSPERIKDQDGTLVPRTEEENKAFDKRMEEATTKRAPEDRSLVFDHTISDRAANKQKENLCAKGCEITIFNLNPEMKSLEELVHPRGDGQVFQRVVRGDVFEWRCVSGCKTPTPDNEGVGQGPMPPVACPGDFHVVIGGNNSCENLGGAFTSQLSNMLGQKTTVPKAGGDPVSQTGQAAQIDSTGAQAPTNYVYDNGTTCTSSGRKKPCRDANDNYYGQGSCSHFDDARFKRDILRQVLWTDPPVRSSSMAWPVDK